MRLLSGDDGREVFVGAAMVTVPQRRMVLWTPNCRDVSSELVGVSYEEMNEPKRHVSRLGAVAAVVIVMVLVGPHRQLRRHADATVQWIKAGRLAQNGARYKAPPSRPGLDVVAAPRPTGSILDWLGHGHPHTCRRGRGSNSKVQFLRWCGPTTYDVGRLAKTQGEQIGRWRDWAEY